jgi:ribosomal protein S21
VCRAAGRLQAVKKRHFLEVPLQIRARFEAGPTG